jgi:hypothetical protein
LGLMMEPPAILDSSLVLLYAVLDDSVTYTGRACVLVGGKSIDPVPCLAICLNLCDDDILLLRCDDEWNVLGAGGYGRVENAQASAETAYAGVGGKWQKFRPLTPEEMAVVESVPQADRKEVRNGLTDCEQAAWKMKVGPSKWAFRSRLQTTASCCGQESWW